MGKLTREAKKERERLDELLSAYLDGQLSEKERAQLEARLASDEVLQNELRALRRTVAMVRDLPRLPVPRNFILPQAIATAKRPVAPARFRTAGFAPWLKAAAALVGVFAVVTCASMLIYLAGGRPAATPPPPREAMPVVQATVVVEATVQLEELAVTQPPIPPTPEAAPMLLAVPETDTPAPMLKAHEGPTQAPTTGAEVGSAAVTPATPPPDTPTVREKQDVYEAGEEEKAIEATEYETALASERVNLIPWVAAGIGGVILALVIILRLRRR